MSDYRYLARQAVARAKQSLESGVPEQLKYAALELRFALEYLTYERARAYRDDIHPSKFNTWQPRKVLQLLLEIDPHADSPREIAFAPETASGELAPGTPFQSLGTDTPVSLATVKAHYDAIGSYLHAPTIRQLEDPKPDADDRLREHCTDALAAIEKTLSSKVFNSVFGIRSEFECDRCGERIVRRFPFEPVELEATCFNCAAVYEVVVKDQKALWKPKQIRVQCSNAECREPLYIWEDDVERGKWWRCKV